MKNGAIHFIVMATASKLEESFCGIFSLGHTTASISLRATCAFVIPCQKYHLTGCRSAPCTAPTQRRWCPQVLRLASLLLDLQADVLSQGHSSWPLLHTRPPLGRPRQFLPTQPRRSSHLLTTRPESGVEMKKKLTSNGTAVFSPGCSCQGTAKRRRMLVSTDEVVVLPKISRHRKCIAPGQDRAAQESLYLTWKSNILHFQNLNTDEAFRPFFDVSFGHKKLRENVSSMCRLFLGCRAFH